MIRKIWAWSSTSAWTGQTGFHHSINHFYNKSKCRCFTQNQVNSKNSLFMFNSDYLRRYYFSRNIEFSRNWQLDS